VSQNYEEMLFKVYCQPNKRQNV